MSSVTEKSSIDEALRLFSHKSVSDFSHDEILLLENTRQQFRKTMAKDSAQYAQLKELVKQVKMANLPLRSYEMWKRGSHEFTQNCFKGMCPGDKATRKDVKAELLEKACSKIMQERLKLLSGITFIHGSGSPTLGMLLHSTEPQLECAGMLFSKNIVPMNGELIWGVEEGGINLIALSVETIRDISRILTYSDPKPFDPELYRYLMAPYRLLRLSELERLTSLIAVLKEWKESKPGEFAMQLSPGKVKTERLIDEIKRRISCLEKGIESRPKHPESIANRAIVSHLHLFMEQLVNGMDLTVPTCNQKVLPKVMNDMLIAFKESPFTLFCKERDWTSKGIAITRIKQWDKRLFDEIVTPFLSEWHEAIHYEYTKQTKHLLLLRAIIDYSFTDDEIFFIRSHAVGAGSSTSEVPASLRELFSATQDIPENRDPFGMFRGGTLSQHMSAYRRESLSWNSALWGVLDSRLKGENLTRFHPLINRELQRIDRGVNFLRNSLRNDHQGFSISQDETIRALFTQPFPIVFASKTVKPKPIDDQPRPSEYVFETPIKLGKGGSDILFTDTPESRERIRAVLPERLREEIEIRLIEEFDVGDIPLTHHPEQVVGKSKQ